MKIDDLKETGTALTKRELVAQIASETGLTQLEVFDVVQKRSTALSTRSAQASMWSFASSACSR